MVKATAAGQATGSTIAKAMSGCYRRIMANKLNALLERLKAYQCDLILDMAGIDGMPTASNLRRVAELENVIAAVEAVAVEEADRKRQEG